MSTLNSIWESAKAREEKQRYGYAVTSAREAALMKATLPPARPVVRKAASLADVLGFRPVRAGRAP